MLKFIVMQQALSCVSDQPIINYTLFLNLNLKVLAVLICMVVIITKVHVNWGDAFQGYIPSKYIFSSGGIYTCTMMTFGLGISSLLMVYSHSCGNSWRNGHAAQLVPRF